MPRETHLLDYLMVLRKHRWLIVSFLLSLVTVVTIATFRMQPVYEATTRIEIDRENTSFLPFAGNDPYDVFQDLEDYIETQSKILVSETLAVQTIKSLNLDQDARFGGRPQFSGTLEVMSPKIGAQSPPPALGAFLGGLSVKRVPNSRLLDIAFSTTDPKLAAAVVNAHVSNFIEQNFRSRYEATTQASNWLANQLDELKGKVEASEDARIKYERDNQIWTIDEKQDVTTQKLADLNRDLTEAQADRINKQAVYELAETGNYDAIPSVRESPVIQETLKRQGELNDQYTEALNQYGPKFPKVLRIEAQLKDIQELIANEKKNVGTQIEAEYRASRERELLLQRALDQQKNEAAAMADKMVQYNILKREAEANKQLYDGLLQKLKEAGITAGLRSSNIRVIDPALVPTTPSRPNKSRNIFLAVLVGLVGGIGLALIREYLDNTVKNPDDVESLSRLPSLAVVPAFDSPDADGTGRLPKLLRGAGNGPQERSAMLSHFEPQSQVSEAFRALRTSLLLSQPDRPPQTILVTSALPHEGKTTAAVNIGVTLAQLGDNTLLIDGDLRKPGISRALHMCDAENPGLSSYLAGVTPLADVTVPHPLVKNLHAIPTGPIPPNSADLLSSHRLAEMIMELRKQYKFIVIDSPPIMAATDAVILSALVDGVLLVVRSGETPKEAFSRTRELLHSVNSR
ncbi:MAG TPA: polysaccharide biosynthesis tyrosine autokinase, partial [Nitrospira sp.]|nr:polysaccharide biosynthesis tyrosine autokinase [Nitrospira sp.]